MQTSKKIVTAVTANLAAVEAAAEIGADVLLVHHGWFWDHENPTVVGIKARRLRAVMQAELNVIAYHLPLDAHLTLGNNVQLAARLGGPIYDR